MEEKFTLTNRLGLKIVGVLERPENEVKGTAITMHGWGSNRDSQTIQTFKNAFLQAGFQTFNFDVTNSNGESDGNFEQSTLGQFANDLEDVVVWVKKQDWYKGPLALTGHSKGGFSVIDYAQKHPEDVSYLVPIAPVISGELSFEALEEYNSVFWNEIQEKKIIIETNPHNDQEKVKHLSQYQERLNHDLLTGYKKVIMPINIFVGENDESCPVKHQAILYDVLPGIEKELTIVPGALHGFYKISEQQFCIEELSKWLKRVMK